MRELLISDGVPDAMIHPEDRSTTTLENIRFAMPLLANAEAGDIAIVTDRTHAMRAGMVARHFRLKATVLCPSLSGIHRPTLIRQAAREIAAIPLYALKLQRVPRTPEP